MHSSRSVHVHKKRIVQAAVSRVQDFIDIYLKKWASGWLRGLTQGWNKWFFYKNKKTVKVTHTSSQIERWEHVDIKYWNNIIEEAGT